MADTPPPLDCRIVDLETELAMANARITELEAENTRLYERDDVRQLQTAQLTERNAELERWAQHHNHRAAMDLARHEQDMEADRG